MVTVGDARVALEHEVGVHIAVSADPADVGDPRMAQASYEEEEYDSNTAAMITGTCLCPPEIEQYDELRALGAIEDGLVSLSVTR